MVRSGPPALWTAAAVACLLSCGPASVQTAGDPRLQNPRIQSAYSEWRKLPQKEVDCVDQTLRNRSSTLWLTIQRGINPSDATVAAIRAACRAQARAANPASVPVAGSQVRGGSHALAASAGARADEAARLAAERVAAAKAAAEKAAADKLAADKAAADKFATDKFAADKLAADKLAAEKQMAAKAAMDRPVAEKATADHPAMDPAKDDAAPVNAGAVKTAPDAERAPHEPAKTTAEAALAYAAAESRMSFCLRAHQRPGRFQFRRRGVPAVAPEEARCHHATGRRLAPRPPCRPKRSRPPGRGRAGRASAARSKTLPARGTPPPACGRRGPAALSVKAHCTIALLEPTAPPKVTAPHSTHPSRRRTWRHLLQWLQRSMKKAMSP